MSTALKDQRDRDRFMRELDQNFCVSAGAGVGKTTAIVERVARLAAENPAALARLVVVTYTKSAAEELRVRTRARVIEQLAAMGSLNQNVVGEMRRAFFGTIHSFCLKLVREHGRALGLPQNIDLLEEEDEQDVWARFSESAALDALPLEAGLLRAVLRFMSFEDLLRLARRIDGDLAETIMRDFAAELQPEVTFSAALADAGKRSVENTRANQDALREWLREWSGDAPFLKLPDFRTGSGSFKESFAQELAPLARWLGNAAARLAAEIALGYRAFRRDERRLTYADQISWCRKLMENPVVLERLRARKIIVILDEAQDTDAGMFSILTELTRPPGTAVGEWPRNKQASGPEPGRFCFVGDEQQAIYGQRADLGTYKSFLDAFSGRSGGERLEFSVTMRCPQRVIAAVNAMFFQDERMRQTHLSFRELHEKPRCEEGAAWLLPIEPVPDEKQIDALFGAECEQVAKFLLEYGPAGLGAHRWNDVAILCPRHKWLAQAADAFFRAGIPCRLVAEKKMRLEQPSRSWPAALLYALVNPWDRFEMIGVLREIFAVSDVDLADAQSVNRPFAFESETGLSPRLAAAMKTLRSLRAEVPGGGTLSRFVERVISEAHLAARLEAIGEAAENLESLRRDALTAECGGVPLREWVDGLCSDLAKSAESSADLADEMPILTCQKSKGLEWPVVIPLGLGRMIHSWREDFPRVQQRGGAVSVHLSPVTVDKALEQERELARREELQRVFYVSLTRAKSLLVLPDSAALYGDKKASFQELCKWSELDCADFLQAPSPLAARAEAKKALELQTHMAPSMPTISEAAKFSRETPRQILRDDLRIDAIQPWRGTGGLDFPAWWHATMRRFPWLAAAREQRDFLLRAVEETGDGLRARAGREIKMGALFRETLAGIGARFLPEADFSFARNSCEWAEGSVDLAVFTREGGVWLIDWQTDQPVADEPEESFRERCRVSALPALEICAEALREVAGVEVSRLVVFSTALGRAI